MSRLRRLVTCPTLTMTTLELTAPPVPVVEGVSQALNMDEVWNSGAAQFAVLNKDPRSFIGVVSLSHCPLAIRMTGTFIKPVAASTSSRITFNCSA